MAASISGPICDSEGISGVVVLQGDSVLFKPNRGEGELGPLQKLARAPSLAAFGAKSHWQDITGAGRLDLVLDDGFHAPDGEDGWVFRYFENAPTIDWSTPNLPITPTSDRRRPFRRAPHRRQPFTLV